MGNANDEGMYGDPRSRLRALMNASRVTTRVLPQANRLAVLSLQRSSAWIHGSSGAGGAQGEATGGV